MILEHTLIYLYIPCWFYRNYNQCFQLPQVIRRVPLKQYQTAVTCIYIIFYGFQSVFTSSQSSEQLGEAGMSR